MSSKRPLISLRMAGISLIDCDHKTPKAQEQGRPYVGIPQLKDGRITLNGARLISEEDFHHWRRKTKPTPDDVVLSRRCNPGESSYVPNALEFALGQNLVLLRSDGTKIYPPFLRWLTQGTQWWSQVNMYINVGAVFDSLKCADIPKFEIYLPELNEQKRIAETLGGLDGKIQINHKINQTLEQMAQAIFKSWFVDFEPVKAKIAALEAGGSEEDALLAAMQAIAGDTQECTNTVEGSAPGAATGGKLTRLQAEQPEQYATLCATAELFPSAMQDSELGEIPEGWSVSSIYEIADVVYGAPFKSKLFNQIGDGTPLIRIRDLKNERPGVRTPEEHPKGYLVQNGDLLVGMDGEFKPYIWGSGPAWMNQRVCCFKPKDSYSVGLIKGFIEPQLRELELTATATTVIHLGKGDINRFEFLNSGSPLLRVFSKITNSLIEQIIMNKSSTSTLEQLRNALLPKLLSGELSVSDAETWPEEAEEHANV